MADLKDAAKRRLAFLRGSDRSKEVKSPNISGPMTGPPNDPSSNLPAFLKKK